MKKLLIAAVAACALAACQTTITGIATADAKLRDKCAYLESGIAIARLASSFVPAAGPLVEAGAPLISAYCTGRPITDLASAMEAMERIIVSVRPIAAQVSQ